MSALDLVTEALVEARGDGGWIVRAPRVGIYRGCPPEGRRPTPCEAVGAITVLNHRMELVLPAGAGGIVTDVRVNDRSVPVEYGQMLFALATSIDGRVLPSPSSPPDAASASGCIAVTCPIDGIFYHRPSPASPPFVAVGDTIETGRTLGLIEAMKSFNAVTYGGQALPPRATIAEVTAADASEVRQGAPLFLVRPAPD